MNTDKVTCIDAASDMEFGTYNLADQFLGSDFSKYANHRFKPITIKGPSFHFGPSSLNDNGDEAKS